MTIKYQILGLTQRRDDATENQNNIEQEEHEGHEEDLF
jgi:hypothetical protein